jgi:hypothetical protein
MKYLWSYSYDNYVWCVLSFGKEPMPYWEWVKEVI